MLQRLLRRAATARYRRVLASATIQPHDAPVASSGQSDAVRVLLLGSGVASGQGVSTYGLALVGRLQRQLQSRLGRPVDVEMVRQHGAGLDQAADLARARAGEDWDAYVLAFGVSDALRLTAQDSWARSLNLLLTVIEDLKSSPLRVPVLVAGIPPLQSFAAHSGVLMPFFARYAERLNQATQRVLEGHPCASFVPLPQMAVTDQRRFGSPDAYERWADVLAERLAPSLRHAVVRMPGSDASEGSRSLASRVLSDEHGDLRERLRGIAERARALVGADLAIVSLVDGDRLCTIADSSGAPARWTPLAGTVFEATSGEPSVVVADFAADARFQRMTLPTLYGLQSYVGITLHGPRGTRIGALCVLNGGAGRASHARELAPLGVEAELELARLLRSGGAGPAPVESVDDEPLRLARAVVHEPLPVPRSPRRPHAEGLRLLAAAAGLAAPEQRRFVLPGPRPVRLLLAGDGLAVGYRVHERRDALDGALARLIHRRTGRGVEVTNRADRTRPRARSDQPLGPEGAGGFDVVVWTSAMAGATGSRGRGRWRAAVEEVVQQVQRTSEAELVLVGLPGLRGRQPFAVLARMRSRALNGLLQQVAARAEGVRVAVPEDVALGDVWNVPPAEAYRAAAIHMLDSVLDAVAVHDGAHPAPRVQRDRAGAPEPA